MKTLVERYFMAKWYSSITDEQAALIRSAPMFFVATADPNLASGPNGAGPVNISPKGGVPLHILGPNHVAFLDYAGSGNETARHSVAGGPITIMVCAFEAENAAIVRLYGKARVTPLADSPIADVLLQRPAEDINLPVRQAIEVDIERTVTSCGYGVPVMSFARQRKVSDRGRSYKEGGLPTKAAARQG
jgi:hypothetical protein